MSVIRQPTGKEKAARVPLEYHERPDRVKRWLIVIMGAGTTVLLLALLATGQWRRGTSPGPVHPVHAAWNDDCIACHAQFQPAHPTSADNGLAALGGIAPLDRLIPFDKSDHSAVKCQECHQGPQHHARQEEKDVPSCAACHREHRGDALSLVRLSDDNCTGCHKDLNNHITGGQSIYADKVTRFDLQHPDFRVDSEGGRTEIANARHSASLKFDHKRHMTLGLKENEGDCRAWKISDIRSAADRERYRQDCEGKTLPRAEADPVQLKCCSCHELDAPATAHSVRDTGPGITDHAAGAYMLPVTYEKHCQACHPLTWDSAPTASPIPHLLQPAEVHRFLWGAYAESAAARKEKPSSWGRPLPNQIVERRAKDTEDFLWQDELKTVERYVWSGKTTCGLCHEYEREPGTIVPRRIIPPAMPDVWLPHATFNHAAHRAFKCLECHRGATTSTDQDRKILLPDIKTCQSCHSEYPTAAEFAKQGVRFTCTTCHRYHNGDHPHSGIGAPTRDPKDKKLFGG